MKLWQAIAPQGPNSVTWAIIQREAAAMFLTDVPAALMSVGRMASPEDIDRMQTAAEEEFHNLSAAMLSLYRPAYDHAAAAGRIEWCRAETAQMHPPFQVRLDGGPWLEMRAEVIPSSAIHPRIVQRAAA